MEVEVPTLSPEEVADVEKRMSLFLEARKLGIEVNWTWSVAEIEQAIHNIDNNFYV